MTAPERKGETVFFAGGLGEMGKWFVWSPGLWGGSVSKLRSATEKNSRQGLQMGWGKGHSQSAAIIPEEKQRVPQLTWYLAVRSAAAWSPGLPSWGRAGTWGTGGAKGGERSQEWEQPFPRAPLQKRVSGTLLHINILVKPMNIYQVLNGYSAPSQHLVCPAYTCLDPWNRIWLRNLIFHFNLMTWHSSKRRVRTIPVLQTGKAKHKDLQWLVPGHGYLVSSDPFPDTVL